MDFTRRLMFTGSAGLALLQAGAADADKDEGQEVSPVEDLMQEHGLLKRALLVYRECVRRLEGGKEVPPDVVPGTAKLIREFIEQYHEKNEEDYIFPRFRKAGKLVELVDTLYTQHRAGRRVTERILAAAAPKDEAGRKELARYVGMFVRMYEPHEAREDTVLFPAFRKLVSRNEYDSLGEQFEKIEHQHFGEDGFEKKVDEVAGIERTLGIENLAQFTPRV